jgi:hypothetical protein
MSTVFHLRSLDLSHRSLKDRALSNKGIKTMFKPFITLIALFATASASPGVGTYRLGESDKRIIIRDVLKYELSGKGMLKPGETLYLVQDNFDPDWLQDLLSPSFVLLTSSDIGERQLAKRFDYVKLNMIKISRVRARISLEGPGRGVTYQYRKRNGRWVMGRIHGYYTHT